MYLINSNFLVLMDSQNYRSNNKLGDNNNDNNNNNNNSGVF